MCLGGGGVAVSVKRRRKKLAGIGLHQCQQGWLHLLGTAIPGAMHGRSLLLQVYSLCSRNGKVLLINYPQQDYLGIFAHYGVCRYILIT